MGDEDFREASRTGWERAAEGWAREAERREGGPAGAAADRMLDAVGLRPGERVLELACGSGELGRRAAEAVGPEGRAVLSDFAEPMVEIARERAAAAGLPQVEARVLDAEDPRLEERFDVVLCRFAYMLMVDPARALRRGRDALAPGGRLALAVWGSAERNPWQSLITDGVMAVLGAPPPEPGAPGPFALADRARLRALLAEAGLDEILLEDVVVERRHESFGAWWSGILTGSGPLSTAVGALTEDQRAAVREHAERGARPFAGPDGGLRLPATVIVASARRGSGEAPPTPRAPRPARPARGNG